MRTLRLIHHRDEAGNLGVSIELHQDGKTLGVAQSRLAVDFNDQDREDLRWYLEDYISYPFDPAPVVAARIERRMAELGSALFGAIFDATSECREVWRAAQERLQQTRIEVVTEATDPDVAPWELLREADGVLPLALRCHSFVNGRHVSGPPSTPDAAPRSADRPRGLVRRLLVRPRPSDRSGDAPRETDSGSGPVRILVVIARPAGAEDVAFRSVAGLVVARVAERADVEVVVLRPPTFGHLQERLAKAMAGGMPFDIVHFDGHGVYEDLAARISGKHPTRRRGYVLFENPDDSENEQLIHGGLLGQALARGGVRVLVLNACRSAAVDAVPEPSKGPFRDRARAFGSLAQEVFDAGVSGVVSMRYNVFVDTAADFVAGLYDALARGAAVGEAVGQGRRQLYRDPERSVGFAVRTLQDWYVPTVHEAAPIPIFARKADGSSPVGDRPGSTQAAPDTSEPPDAPGATGLPNPPDTGFQGGDASILAIDRAFDQHPVVLLQGPAGSGKTATVAEFARWYELTGGVVGPVLFTSFERYAPVVVVFDAIERAFGEGLARQGVQWPALDEAQRRDATLQVLKTTSVLWVWDNVEQVAGFPADRPSAWSEAEQQALADFLRRAAGVGARFLLTSRRDEAEWLGGLPARLSLPPLPIQDRYRLAQAVADTRGGELGDSTAWWPLIEFTQGNPLTLRVVVGEAVREGLVTREEIEAFVERLREGAATVGGNGGDSASDALEASLAYGFAHAFDDDEQRRLAVLHLFQGWVQAGTLETMGDPDEDWALPSLRGITRAETLALLRRAADVGLLSAHGNWFGVHPALPWHFRRLFERYYPEGAGADGDTLRTRAIRAFVDSLAGIADLYTRQHRAGERRVLSALATEEANLHHATRLARERGWWDAVVALVQGLRTLYLNDGRRAAWGQLADDIAGEFVEPTTGGPVAGRERFWSLAIELMASRAQVGGRQDEAERLQRVRLQHNREEAAAALAIRPEDRDEEQRNAVHTLAATLEQLAQLLRDRGGQDCVPPYQEAFSLHESNGDPAAAAVVATALGHVHIFVPDLRDLDKAEQWTRRGLDLLARPYRLERSNALRQLGTIASERFSEARRAQAPDAELLPHLRTALELSRQALALTPKEATGSLMTVHALLGMIMYWGDKPEAALTHYQEAIRYQEAGGDRFSAAGLRYNVAAILFDVDRFADARTYAESAVRGYESYGDLARGMTERARYLLEQIDAASMETRARTRT